MKLKLTLLFAILSFSIHAEETEVGLWYTGANPDYKPFESNYGFATTVSTRFQSGIFYKLLYNETDFLASGPEVGHVQVNSWTEGGIGYYFPEEWGNFYSYLTYSAIDSERNNFTGLGFHLGYYTNWSKNWTGKIQFGHIDTEFHDFQLEGQIQYHWNDNLSLNFGLRDYDDWDYTSYEAGIIYNF